MKLLMINLLMILIMKKSMKMHVIHYLIYVSVLMLKSVGSWECLGKMFPRANQS